MSYFSNLTVVGIATLVVLGICSIIVVAVVLERLYYFRNNVVNSHWLHACMANHLSGLINRKKGEKSGANPEAGLSLEERNELRIQAASAEVSRWGGLLPQVYECGLARFRLSQEAGEEAMSTAIADQRQKLETRMPIISTIAVIAPFIGLAGTVGGIIKTFADVAEKGQAGVAVVSAGVSEALVATAFGLVVAITSVVAYNYFKARVSSILADMYSAASRLSEMMELMRKDQEFPEDLVVFNIKK